MDAVYASQAPQSWQWQGSTQTTSSATTQPQPTDSQPTNAQPTADLNPPTQTNSSDPYRGQQVNISA